MLHGFSGVFALLGNIPNSDSGLAKLHETRDAKGVRVMFLSSCAKFTHKHIGSSFRNDAARMRMKSSLT